MSICCPLNYRGRFKCNTFYDAVVLRTRRRQFARGNVGPNLQLNRLVLVGTTDIAIGEAPLVISESDDRCLNGRNVTAAQPVGA